MAKKELTADEITQIANDLHSKQRAKRRNAAKKIKKNKLEQLGFKYLARNEEFNNSNYRKCNEY